MDWNEIELKRKKVLDPAMCALAGCRHVTKLYHAEHPDKGRITICEPCCVEHGIEPLELNEGVTPEGAAAAPAAAEVHEAEFVEEERTKLAIASEQSELAGVAAEIAHFDVCDDDSLALAGELLVDVKTRQKRITEMKQSATRPMNEALKNIRAWFAPAEELLGTIEREVKNKVASYHTLLEIERERATEALGKEGATSAEVGAALTNLGAAQAPKTAGVSMREVWDFEVLDMRAVPVGFLQVNEADVRRAIANGLHAIPGLRIFKKPVVAVTAKK